MIHWPTVALFAVVIVLHWVYDALAREETTDDERRERARERVNRKQGRK